MKCTLLIPTLNEVIGMKAIMPRIDRSWFTQILVVDGGSTDGTVEWARENGYEVVEQTTRGIRRGYMEALPHVQGEVVVTFSPDGNCLVELLPVLVAKMAEGYDMVIVSRYQGEAQSADDDWVTAFGNWFFTTVVNRLHGGHYTDCMGIYRAYRVGLVQELGLDRDEAYATPERWFRTNLSWEPLLSVRAARAGLRVAEMPGDEPARIGGERKLEVFRWGAGYFFQFIREALFPFNRK